MATNDSSVKHHQQAAELAQQWRHQGDKKTIWLRFTKDWKNNPKKKILAGNVSAWPIGTAALYVICGRADKVDKPEPTELEPCTEPDVEVKFLDSVASASAKFDSGKSYILPYRQATKYIDRSLAVPVQSEPQRAVAPPTEKRGKRRA